MRSLCIVLKCRDGGLQSGERRRHADGIESWIDLQLQSGRLAKHEQHLLVVLGHFRRCRSVASSPLVQLMQDLYERRDEVRVHRIQAALLLDL
ncbi:MAG TPA: hypothetical protein VFP68_23300 [Burkholderiaceae bacterium]|nr:hypothetical protein [Burkholderiaceae bacterium]